MRGWGESIHNTLYTGKKLSKISSNHLKNIKI